MCDLAAHSDETGGSSLTLPRGVEKGPAENDRSSGTTNCTPSKRPLFGVQRVPCRGREPLARSHGFLKRPADRRQLSGRRLAKPAITDGSSRHDGGWVIPQGVRSVQDRTFGDRGDASRCGEATETMDFVAREMTDGRRRRHFVRHRRPRKRAAKAAISMFMPQSWKRPRLGSGD